MILHSPCRMFLNTNINICLHLLQGSTIKPLVALLNIARLRVEKETLNNEINDNVSETPSLSK
jgi:hypothetical protein